MNYKMNQLLPHLQNYRVEIRYIKEENRYAVINNYTEIVEFHGTMLPEIIPVLYHLEAGLDATMDQVVSGELTTRMSQALMDDLEELDTSDIFDELKADTKTRLQ